jgi:hypothetical protein
MLKQITQYLSDEDFVPVPAQPVKALMPSVQTRHNFAGYPNGSN